MHFVSHVVEGLRESRAGSAEFFRGAQSHPLKYRADKISRDSKFREIEFVAMRKVERNSKFRGERRQTFLSRSATAFESSTMHSVLRFSPEGGGRG